MAHHQLQILPRNFFKILANDVRVQRCEIAKSNHCLTGVSEFTVLELLSHWQPQINEVASFFRSALHYRNEQDSVVDYFPLSVSSLLIHALLNTITRHKNTRDHMD